ncbi:MAG: ABC transporter ATP-binding protein [Fidelibacterota bacterium]|nr:MAG: ABC transporter ATP-binding protein [Candidatus Neomarinimicrobiota bacterium]
MILLTAEDIHKSYPLNSGRLQILKGVNLEVEQGSIVALMGPSGSGKSTLLNILGTLDQPDRGRILLNGQDISNMTDNELSRFRNRNIGFVFQFHHLLPELTLWENLELPLWLANNRRALDTSYLRQLLELTGLVDRCGHYPSQLSGGERQRVAVIRALVNRPGIVLADEPTGNLDAENGAILLNLIKQLRRDHGQTFLIATHSETLTEKVDRRLYLHKGVIGLTPEVDE